MEIFKTAAYVRTKFIICMKRRECRQKLLVLEVFRIDAKRLKPTINKTPVVISVKRASVKMSR